MIIIVRPAADRNEAGLFIEVAGWFVGTADLEKACGEPLQAQIIESAFQQGCAGTRSLCRWCNGQSQEFAFWSIGLEKSIAIKMTVCFCNPEEAASGLDLGSQLGYTPRVLHGERFNTLDSVHILFSQPANLQTMRSATDTVSSPSIFV